MITEALYYNAIATGMRGDYAAIAKLRNVFGSWKEAYENAPHGKKIFPDTEEAGKKLKEIGCRLLLSEEKDYPSQLSEIPHPPFGIYLIGALDLGNENLAVVGTRRATQEGKQNAKYFAKILVRQDFIIVSGLAFGIDAAAHGGALEESGKTIAVLANGLGNIYPHNHEHLAQRILSKGGAIISEYPPDEIPYPYRFLERNRIISGLSKGVLVIEAPESSGSIATARFALEQNRDVFVIPGNISHPNFKGSHELIRQGAELVAKPEHILAAYGLEEKDIKNKATASVSPQEMLILKALEKIHGPADIDKLIEETKLEPRIVNQTVSFLLIKDLIEETGGGYTILK